MAITCKPKPHAPVPARAPVPLPTLVPAPVDTLESLVGRNREATALRIPVFESIKADLVKQKTEIALLKSRIRLLDGR